MQFFKIEAEIANMDEGEIKLIRDDYDARKMLKKRHHLYREKNDKKCLYFISAIHKRAIIFGVISYNHKEAEKGVREYAKELGIEFRDAQIEEITLGALSALGDDSLIRVSDLFEEMGIESIMNSFRSIKFVEKMIPENADKDDLMNRAGAMLCSSELGLEIERIYTPVAKHIEGHPVHYVLQSDDCEVAEEIEGILAAALYANNRISNRRLCSAPLQSERKSLFGIGDSFDKSEFTALYKAFEGGIISVDLSIDMSEDEDIVSGELEKVEKVCKTVLRNRNKILTIFKLPRAAERIKTVLREHMDTVTLVELSEDEVSYEQAKAFLKQCARGHKVKVDKSLYKDVKDTDATYTVSDLKISFRRWYDNQLKTKYYKQYADFNEAGRLAVKDNRVKGDAGRELEKMIGLEEAKEVIQEAVDYYKAQKLFRERGVAQKRPTMHMAFYGSPGTAKTSVARLFARIMKDNGLLSVGSLVEVGRADLVGKYVGWTAQIVKDAFRRAKGSVLFIDEAYSLVDGKAGYYGDEAINMIVQEMENAREDIVVIFAGYTDKMEEFIARNPGLRSRIAFHVPFKDYSTDELLQILRLMADKNEVKIDGNVDEKLIPILEKASLEPDFGNGRYIRNLLERAHMKQAARLVKMNADKVTKKVLTTLTADDFEPPARQSDAAKKIGFSA